MKRLLIIKRVAIALAVLQPLAGFCAPVVIYDSGNTVSNDLFIGKLSQEPDRAQLMETAKSLGFPLQSTWVSGSFSLKEKLVPMLPMPFFVVGCDQRSKDWLQDRTRLLQAMKAIGFVVDCSSLEAYEAMKSAFDPLRIQPSLGGDISKYLGHNIYPALITGKTIEQ